MYIELMFEHIRVDLSIFCTLPHISLNLVEVPHGAGHGKQNQLRESEAWLETSSREPNPLPDWPHCLLVCPSHEPRSGPRN